MTSETKASLALTASTLFVGAVFGWCLAFGIISAVDGMPRVRFESEAVNAGAAEYYLDHDNVRQFRWKKSTP